MPNSEYKVERAKTSEQAGTYVSFIYSVLMDTMRDKALGESPTRVNRQRFVQFVKHFMKDISESHATDMFMHVLKKLH